ncbi:excitatory amino acid transporter 1-like isoform X2 [Lampetra fluviatilis]
MPGTEGGSAGVPAGRPRFRDGVRVRTAMASKCMRGLTVAALRRFLARNAFVIFTLLGVVLGIVMGFCLRVYPLSRREVRYFLFPGELLMRMLHMLVLPLIVSSLVTGMSTLDRNASSRMGVRAAVYYMITTLLAVFVGIVMVMAIQPGRGGRDAPRAHNQLERLHAADAFLDLIRNMFPPNLVEACFKQYKTQYETVKIPRGHATTTAATAATATAATATTERLSLTVAVMNATAELLRGNATSAEEAAGFLLNATAALAAMRPEEADPAGSAAPGEEEEEELVPAAGSSNGMNVLGLVVFSMCFGLVLSSVRERGQVVRDFFDSLNETIMKLVTIIMWYAPVGIMFLITGRILEMEDLGAVGGQLGLYTVTVIAGLAVHSLVVLPLLFFLFTRRNPWTYIGGVLQALVTALGTSSSSATLPVTFKCLEENLGVDKRVTRFVLPVGATINMDGTALYEAVAAIFIAQVNDYELNLGQIITISITATAASIGAAGIPQAGLVTMIIVLTSVGLPTEDITLIIAVDWFLDRLRTTTNVLGDSLGAGIVEHLSRHELARQDALEMAEAGMEGDVGGIAPRKGSMYQPICPEEPLGCRARVPHTGSTTAASSLETNM